MDRFLWTSKSQRPCRSFLSKKISEGTEVRNGSPSCAPEPSSKHLPSVKTACPMKPCNPWTLTCDWKLLYLALPSKKMARMSQTFPLSNGPVPTGNGHVYCPFISCTFGGPTWFESSAVNASWTVCEPTYPTIPEILEVNSRWMLRL